MRLLRRAAVAWVVAAVVAGTMGGLAGSGLTDRARMSSELDAAREELAEVNAQARERRQRARRLERLNQRLERAFQRCTQRLLNVRDTYNQILDDFDPPNLTPAEVEEYRTRVQQLRDTATASREKCEEAKQIAQQANANR